jgi:5-deoxy-D-glucuronate isomerase
MCFQNTLDQLKIQGADSLCIIHVTTQSEHNSSVPPKSPVERSEWI